MRQLLDQRPKMQGTKVWLVEDQEACQDKVDLEDHLQEIEAHHQVIQITEALHQDKAVHQDREAHLEAHQDKEVHHQAIHRIGVHLQDTHKIEVLLQVIQAALQAREVPHKITCSETQIHSALPRSDDFIIIESF